MNRIDDRTAQRIAKRINRKLQQLITGESFSFELDEGRVIRIPPPESLTAERIQEFTDWIAMESIEPINGGVHAIRDIMLNSDINIPLEQLAEAILAIDILSDIIRPGTPSVKTSMYALSEVLKVYSQKSASIYAVAKIEPENICEVRTPLLANFSNESYVTVTSVGNDGVHIKHLGCPSVMRKTEFTTCLSGFVLAPDLNNQNTVSFELVPRSMQAFVWG